MPEVSKQYMDFKYLPTSGELPGASFEEQTVAIINEIGNVAYQALELAQASQTGQANYTAGTLTAVPTAFQASAPTFTVSEEAFNALLSRITLLETKVETLEQEWAAISAAYDGLTSPSTDAETDAG